MKNNTDYMIKIYGWKGTDLYNKIKNNIKFRCKKQKELKKGTLRWVKSWILGYNNVKITPGGHWGVKMREKLLFSYVFLTARGRPKTKNKELRVLNNWVKSLRTAKDTVAPLTPMDTQHNFFVSNYYDKKNITTKNHYYDLWLTLWQSVLNIDIKHGLLISKSNFIKIWNFLPV